MWQTTLTAVVFAHAVQVSEMFSFWWV